MDKLIWHNEKRKVSELIPFEHNPRKMTEDQVKALTKSLDKFGLVEIPAIDIDNKLVAGHQRTKILLLTGKGEEEIDVRVPNRKLTDQEFKEYNVRSNQNRGMFDFELLGSLFNEQELMDIGFSARELDMVDFPELDDVSFTEDVPEPENSKYELIFSTQADYKDFMDIVKKIQKGYKAQGEDKSLSNSLLSYLRENYGKAKGK